MRQEEFEFGDSGKPPRIGTFTPPPPYGARDSAPTSRQPPKLIAWCPPGSDPYLTGVMVPQGSVVTERMWWLALADRVTELVMRDPEPEEAAKWACRALRVAGGDSPQEVGQFLVEGNSELRQNLYLQLAAIEDPFPAVANEEVAEVIEAMAETDLELWINLAEPEMRARGSDD